MCILCTTAKYEDLYAFSYNPKQNDSERLRGWQLIDLAQEYKRMGVPNSNWQLSDANRDYKVTWRLSGEIQKMLVPESTMVSSCLCKF